MKGNGAQRARVRVRGIVQGVGFRPFVYDVAARNGLAGFVSNDSDGVIAELEGNAEAVRRAVVEIRDHPPALAVVDEVTTEPVTATGDRGFAIVPSAAGGERRTLVSPDMATCDDCLRELHDPADRRHRYPFINCTNCGPRFTITIDVPYDRPNTTMAAFGLCEDCATEYRDPANRRFHAQPVCCPACGPQLRLVPVPRRVGRMRASGSVPAAGKEAGDPLVAAVSLLRAGQILAVKGLGGYHLATSAEQEEAVARLRSRKHREERPFAVLVADLEMARSLCVVGEEEARLLSGPRRPIVLLERRRDAPVAPSVAPAQRTLGLMLPYTPLHHLLAHDYGGAIVLTSGNLSDEPIAYDDADADQRLAGIADAFLTHDRGIHVRTDDSVTRWWPGGELLVRRSRGYAPAPVTLPRDLPRSVLGCGAHLKHTFCLAKGRAAFVSHHIGDLENLETMASFVEGVEHFRRIFDVDIQVAAHDLHPEYLSTKHAYGLEGVELVGVQHHHAHIASCLADNGTDRRVIGVAFDGTGLGDDGTLWGGEVLLADLERYERVAHLTPVPLPGGEAAIRQPWRMAAVWLDAAYGQGHPASAPHPAAAAIRDRHAGHWDAVLSMAAGGVNAPMTSSVGRLFDAVAAILGIRDAITYEGQAAIELEELAHRTPVAAYPAAVSTAPGLQIDGAALVRAVADDLVNGTDRALIAARFHGGLAASVVEVCLRVRDERGVNAVALSGGVFQNTRLLAAVGDGLAAAGFEVLRHRQVPCNDGGISLGQVAVAGARDRAAGP
jgi:hydrogenase maturation protein HypF